MQGDWAHLFLEPYLTRQATTDLFAFKSPTPWVTRGQGWETSTCFTPLNEYPAGWRARGENATNLDVSVAADELCQCFASCEASSLVPLALLLNRAVSVGVRAVVQVAWGERVACFMPAKRFSTPLLQSINGSYLQGKGGYNEIAVPTINAMAGGSFGTASEVRPSPSPLRVLVS